MLKEREFYAKGKRGLTYKAKLDGKTVLVKEKNPDSVVNTLSNEAKMLLKVNKKGIGPKLILYERNRIVMEFVEGLEFLGWAEKQNSDSIINALVDILNQCRALDKMGISKKEMTRPYKHILMSCHGPVQIDFERATETEKPKNVTQLSQWLISGRLNETLKHKGIQFDKEKIRVLAKQYKEDFSEKSFMCILNEVKG